MRLGVLLPEREMCNITFNFYNINVLVVQNCVVYLTLLALECLNENHFSEQSCQRFTSYFTVILWLWALW